MQKRRLASYKQNLEYINILQESCKIETFTEIESLQGPTTLYGRLSPVHVQIPKMMDVCFRL
jgi:hypothetical protein